MAGVKVRRAAYKDVIQPALQRRFTATALLLICASYCYAILFANWNSCRCWSRDESPPPSANRPPSPVVLVPNRPHGHPRRLPPPRVLRASPPPPSRRLPCRPAHRRVGPPGLYRAWLHHDDGRDRLLLHPLGRHVQLHLPMVPPRGGRPQLCHLLSVRPRETERKGRLLHGPLLLARHRPGAGSPLVGSGTDHARCCQAAKGGGCRRRSTDVRHPDQQGVGEAAAHPDAVHQLRGRRLPRHRHPLSPLLPHVLLAHLVDDLPAHLHSPQDEPPAVVAPLFLLERHPRPLCELPPGTHLDDLHSGFLSLHG